MNIGIYKDNLFDIYIKFGPSSIRGFSAKIVRFLTA
jgi:hypothetical protein